MIAVLKNHYPQIRVPVISGSSSGMPDLADVRARRQPVRGEHYSARCRSERVDCLEHRRAERKGGNGDPQARLATERRGEVHRAIALWRPLLLHDDSGTSLSASASNSARRPHAAMPFGLGQYRRRFPGSGRARAMFFLSSCGLWLLGKQLRNVDCDF